jgi:hypothetical protein
MKTPELIDPVFPEVSDSAVKRRKRLNLFERILAVFVFRTPDEQCAHAPAGEMCIDCATDWAIK